MRSRRRNAPNVPTSLHRSASASNRRFSHPEKLRRLAIATTSEPRRAASGETISPVALRAPSATVSPEEPDNPFKEDFNNEVMCMSYLYSKLPETGVPLLIGTGGTDKNEFKNQFGLHMEERREKQPDEYVRMLLDWASRGTQKLPCIIFDNTDQFPTDIQDAVYQMAHSF